MEIFCETSNRLGCFRVLTKNDLAPELFKALHKIITPLRKEPDDTGRGVMFYAASDLFEPLLEGAEIPEYRIESIHVDARFPQPDHEARRINSDRFAFVAIRKIIIRVPPAVLGHAVPRPVMH